MLADKYGRKWLLVLNIAQIQLRAMWMYLVLSFPDVIPIRFIWLEAALGLLGGGSMVATALLFVIVSDVTPSSQT
jgi:MFS family permease